MLFVLLAIYILLCLSQMKLGKVSSHRLDCIVIRSSEATGETPTQLWQDDSGRENNRERSTTTTSLWEVKQK